MDSTGAGPEASIVGNALDRGFGHTRYGDHFQTFCGLQIVLADGRVLDTGFGHFKEARARWVFRYGIGPFLDGIFSQSNFGIVTRMGLWLMPEPETFRAFFFSTPDDSKISDLVDRLSPLKKQALLPSAVHIANDLRALSARLQYPWERAGGAHTDADGSAGAAPSRARRGRVERMRRAHGSEESHRSHREQDQVGAQVVLHGLSGRSEARPGRRAWLAGCRDLD